MKKKAMRIADDYTPRVEHDVVVVDCFGVSHIVCSTSGYPLPANEINISQSGIDAGRSFSYFHRIKRDNPEQYEYIMEIGGNDVAAGYRMYEEEVAMIREKFVKIVEQLTSKGRGAKISRIVFGKSSRIRILYQSHGQTYKVFVDMKKVIDFL